MNVVEKSGAEKRERFIMRSDGRGRAGERGEGREEKNGMKGVWWW